MVFFHSKSAASLEEKRKQALDKQKTLNFAKLDEFEGRKINGNSISETIFERIVPNPFENYANKSKKEAASMQPVIKNLVSKDGYVPLVNNYRTNASAQIDQPIVKSKENLQSEPTGTNLKTLEPTVNKQKIIEPPAIKPNIIEPTVKRQVSEPPPVKKQKTVEPDVPPYKKARQLEIQMVSAKTFSCTATDDLHRLFLSIPNAEYDNELNVWNMPLSEYQVFTKNVPSNRKPKHLTPPAVLDYFTPVAIERRRRELEAEFDLDYLDKSFKETLFPFQAEGVQWGLRMRGRFLLADEMGLGKTLQALAIALYYRREWPILILAPASLVSNWAEKAKQWLGINDDKEMDVVFDGRGALTGTKVNIISYDLAKRPGPLEYIRYRKFRMIIADECHALKNEDSERCKALLPILEQADRLLLLSGTPVLSRPWEMYTIIRCLRPGLFRNFREYGNRYCAPRKVPGRNAWEFLGKSNLEELSLILSTFMLRRTKDEVLTQLPPKTREQIFLKLEKKDVDFFAGRRGDISRMPADLDSLQKDPSFMDLFRMTSQSKKAPLLKYIEDLLDEEGSKMLVFGHHRDMLDSIQEHMTKKKHKYIRIDGSTPPSQRQELCNRFQMDPQIRIAILSITAAGTGLTLTAARTVIFAELYFVPGALLQAEDRAHRIGQTDNVLVKYLLAKGTTDDRIWPLLMDKLNTLQNVGLGRNDFGGIVSRDANQKTLNFAGKTMKDNPEAKHDEFGLNVEDFDFEL